MSARVVPALCLGLAVVVVAGVGVTALRVDASTADPAARSAVAGGVAPVRPLTDAGPLPGPSSTSARPRPAAAPDTAARRAPMATDGVARAVFEAVNSGRHAAGRPPLNWSPGLAQAAHHHNVAMAAVGVLAHQVGTEPGLAVRARDRGVNWITAAENIGWSSDLLVSGALGVEAAMLNEPGGRPNHRANILSETLNRIGVDVLVDAVHHRLWLTEDFAQV